jgi:hypothetical protein
MAKTEGHSFLVAGQRSLSRDGASQHAFNSWRRRYCWARISRELPITLELVRGECQSAPAAVDFGGLLDSVMFPESGR